MSDYIKEKVGEWETKFGFFFVEGKEPDQMTLKKAIKEDLLQSLQEMEERTREEYEKILDDEQERLLEERELDKKMGWPKRDAIGLRLLIVTEYRKKFALLSHKKESGEKEVKKEKR